VGNCLVGLKRLREVLSDCVSQNAQRYAGNVLGGDTTCCSAGLSESALTTQPGTIRCSRKTATGCWKATSRRKFLAAVLAQPKVKKLLSSDHFSVDGTLIEAWASMKSVKPKDGSGEPPAQGGGRNAEADFHGQKRSNDTHASTTDPDARLYRKGKGKETKLCFIGHGLMENRHGLLIDACLTLADGHAERVAALHMIEPRADRPTAITLGADKAYDAEDFVNELRSMNVTPHVAQNTSGRSSAIDGRTTRHSGYAVSQRIRKRIEEAFGWIKTVAGQEQTRFRGRERVGWAFTFTAAAYNLVRLPKLIAEAG